MFKEKSTKKRVPLTEASKELTLDARHNKMIETFEEQSNEWIRLKKKEKDMQLKQQLWKDKIQEMSKLDESDYNEDMYQEAWSSNLEIADKLIVIHKRIKHLENLHQEVHYFERTGKILFEYYELLEKQHISTEELIQITSTTTRSITTVQKPIVRGRKRHIPVQSKSILDAFQEYSQSQVPTEAPSTIENDILSENIPLNENEEELLNPTKEESEESSTLSLNDKRALVEQYMAIVDASYIRPHYQEVHIGQCPHCHIMLTYLMQDGITVCNECGFQELLLVEQNKPIYRQPTKEASHFSYKRINHFNEWISQIQGKESTDIPEEIFERIVSEIKKEKILDSSKLTYPKMREILKKLKINKYYEHIYYIISRINGQPTPNFTPDIEEKLRTMFKEIQGPFLKHCPKDRKNFLSYSYVLYKFFQLLEKDEFLKHFPLLKSREKLHLQDQIWRKICEELNWQYIESI
jgi:hypothetical protein